MRQPTVCLLEDLKQRLELADRYGTDVIDTLDERHFRVVQSMSGRPLRTVPAVGGA